MSDNDIDLSVEVPGSPEQVWAAIATGDGLSSWCQPTEVEERAGGRYAYRMPEGFAGSGVVTTWDPPHRVAIASRWDPAGGLPAADVASEWTVEARAGGSAVVRMVMSGFGDAEGWDEEVEGMTEGFASGLRMLRLYLARFAGQRCAWASTFGQVDGPVRGGWPGFAAALGLHGVTEGAAVAGAAGFAGVAEYVTHGRWRDEVLLRLTDPAPGLASVLVVGERNFAGITARFFGTDAAATAADAAARWRDWMGKHYPTMGENGE